MKEELKELSFQMMLNEMQKLQIENSNSYSIMNRNTASVYSDEENKERGLLEADKKGFELSLAFNELLLKNGKNHNKFSDGPDAVDIWATNFLYKYGLEYPISWYIEYEDSNGLHFGYYKSDIIDKNHDAFLAKVEKIKTSVFEKKRIFAISKYYKERRKLLSKYHNMEAFEEEETKGHTR